MPRGAEGRAGRRPRRPAPDGPGLVDGDHAVEHTRSRVGSSLTAVGAPGRQLRGLVTVAVLRDS